LGSSRFLFPTFFAPPSSNLLHHAEVGTVFSLSALPLSIPQMRPSFPGRRQVTLFHLEITFSVYLPPLFPLAVWTSPAFPRSPSSPSVLYSSDRTPTLKVFSTFTHCSEYMRFDFSGFLFSFFPPPLGLFFLRDLLPLFFLLSSDIGSPPLI